MVKGAKYAQIVQIVGSVLAHRDDVVNLAPVAASASPSGLKVLTQAASTTPRHGPVALVLRPVVSRVLAAFLRVVDPRHGSDRFLPLAVQLCPAGEA